MTSPPHSIVLALLLLSVTSCVGFLISHSVDHRKGNVVSCWNSLSNRREASEQLLLALSPLVFATKFNADSMQSVSSSSDPKTVGWGIVGLGDVTAVKAGPPFYKCEGSRLVAVMGRTPGAANEWIKKNLPSSVQPCRGYDNLQEFLKDDQLDAVYVATPPGAHLEVALQVAAAGKAAYIEKPVGRCGWETNAIAKAFQDKGLPLYTAYVSRAYERTQTIIKMIQDEKVLGDRITSIKHRLRGSDLARGLDWSHGVPWRLNATQSGGGLIMDVGCHVLDRIDYICGPIVNVEAVAENRHSPTLDVEDFVEIRGKIGPSSWALFPSQGATVECTWDFSAADAPLDELVLEGPRGSLKMAAMSPASPVSVLGPNGKILREIEFEAPKHAAQRLIQQVTDELLGIPGAKSLSRGDNAIRTSALLDVALGGYYGGRQDDFCSRPNTWPGRTPP